MFQREDTVTWESDTASIRAVQRDMDFLVKSVHNAVASLDKGTVENWILLLEQIINDVYDYISVDIAGQIHGIVTLFQIELHQYMMLFQALVEWYLDNLEYYADSDEGIRFFLEECVWYDPTPIDFTDENWEEDMWNFGPEDYIDPSDIPSLVPNCTALADVIDAICEIPNAYITTISALYDNTDGDPTLIPEHNHCLEAMDKIDENFVNATKNLTGLLRTMFENPHHKDLMIMAQQILDIMENTEFAHYFEIYRNIQGSCGWLGDIMEREEVTSVMGGIINAMNAIPALKSAFDDYKKYVNTMKNLLTNNLNSSLVAINGYLRGNTTKLDMAKVFHSMLVHKSLEELIMMEVHLHSVTGDIKDITASISHYMKSDFEAVFEMDLPMLNDERIAGLDFTQFALSLENHHINDLYANMSQDRKGNLLEMIDEAFSAVYEPLNLMKTEVSILIKEAGGKMNEYAEVLAAYQQENRMNQDFFM